MNLSKQRSARQRMIWTRAGAIGGLNPIAAKERADYDSKAGIGARLTSLDGLNAVINARVKAGYKRRERLGEWVVLGRYFLDAAGNIDEIVNLPNADVMSPDSLPAVLSRDEFFQGPYAPYWSEEGCSMRTMGRSGRAIPPASMPCAICKKAWSISDCWDCEVSSKESVLPLHAYIGKTLADVRQALNLLPDAEYRIQREGAIRNDDLIDLNPDPRYSGSPINQLGWMEGSVPDSYVIRRGDEASVKHFRFEHSACRKEWLATLVENQFRSAFEQAGYNAQSLEFTRIPNLRGGESEKYNGPGFQVSAPFGRIVIGWRKSVIELNWSPTGKDLSSLFADVRTLSKGPHYIHAYGYEETANFLGRLRGALAPSTHAAH